MYSGVTKKTPKGFFLINTGRVPRLLPLLHPFPQMVPIPFSPSSRSSKVFGKHFTPRTRNKIYTSRRTSIFAVQIVLRKGISVFHIYDVTKRFRTQNWDVSRLGRRCPKLLIKQNKNYINLIVNRDFFVQFRHFCDQICFYTSMAILRRYFKKVGIMYHFVCLQPFLIEK